MRAAILALAAATIPAGPVFAQLPTLPSAVEAVKQGGLP